MEPVTTLPADENPGAIAELEPRHALRMPAVEREPGELTGSSLPHRAVTWAYLLPRDISYSVVGGDDWFRAALSEGQAGTPRALVIWHKRGSNLPDLDRFHAVVAIDWPRLPIRQLQRAGFSRIRHFAALPNLAEARWFIPLGPPRDAAAGLGVFSPIRRSSQVKLAAAQAVARTGIPLWYRDHVWIAQREPSPLDRLLRSLFPEHTAVSLNAGTPGPEVKRKVSLGVVGPHGDLAAFIKLGSSPIARSLVLREAKLLEALNADADVGPLVPTLLHSGDVDGDYVSVASAIRGRFAPMHISHAHRAFLRTLLRSEIVRLDVSAIVAALDRSMRGIAQPRPEIPPRFVDALRPLHHLTLSVAINHGDFYPPNLREHDGVLHAFDWEHGDLKGLPFYDELVHRLLVGQLVEHWSEDRAIASLRAVEPPPELRLGPRELEALQGLFLMRFLVGLRSIGHSANEPFLAWLQRLVHHWTGVVIADS